MKEKPILFSGPMVLAILEGRKTQTRRLVKPGKGQNWLTKEDLGQVVQMVDCGDGWWAMSVDERPLGPDGICPGHIGSVRAPYQVGTRLWVRETLKKHVEAWCWLYGADGNPVMVRRVEDMAAMAGWAHHKQQSHCVSIHMPRWASRITLEVTEVRAQRLQDITEDDAKAEGVNPMWHEDVPYSYRGGFAGIIDEVNSAGTWASNPWVWAYTFRRLS
jgi:hypothetical protein